MGANSKIEWTHHTFNPWIGCTKVSDGCKFCYAETLMDNRLGQAKWGPKGTRKVTSDANWAKPVQWDRDAKAEGVRKRVFCASLADVFEGPETYPAEFDATLAMARVRLFQLIEKTPNLDWLLLTKRSENVLPCVPAAWWNGFPPNVWLGTSVENQEAAEQRIPHLLLCPAAVRFLSVEPMLGPVDLREFLRLGWEGGEQPACRAHGMPCVHPSSEPCFSRGYCQGIGWVICGGESGPNVRPMHPDWARSLRDQCVAAAVPFFFKQWGEWHPRRRNGAWPDNREEGFATCDHLPSWWISPRGLDFDGKSDKGSALMKRVGKKAAGRLLDGRTWDEFPEVRK